MNELDWLYNQPKKNFGEPAPPTVPKCDHMRPITASTPFCQECDEAYEKVRS